MVHPSSAPTATNPSKAKRGSPATITMSVTSLRRGSRKFLNSRNLDEESVMKRCSQCHGRLGLGVVRAFFKLFCGVRCRDAYRSALYERAKRQLDPHRSQ